MKRSSIPLIAMLLVLPTLTAFAQPPAGQRWGNRMMAQRQQLKDALKFTDQQQTQVQKFHLDLERKQAQVHSKIQLARLDMKEMYLSDKIDRPAVEKSIKQISDLQQQLKMNFVDFWFSVNNILTPDQQKVWKKHAAMMANEMRGRLRGGMHQGRRGMGMPPGPPREEGNDN